MGVLILFFFCQEEEASLAKRNVWSTFLLPRTQPTPNRVPPPLPLQARSNALLRSNQGKDRVMTELREGSKILEDQLRLMDEKVTNVRI